MTEVLTYDGLGAARDRFLQERPTLESTLSDLVPPALRHRVGALVGDVNDAVFHQLVPATRDLASEQDRVDGELARQFELLAQRLDGQGLAEPAAFAGPLFAADGSYERVRMAFKACLISVRSLHDALNVSARFILYRAWPATEKASMRYTANHREAGLGALIEEQLPDYFDWFAIWRKQRNRVKEGVGLGTFRLDGDIGIQFQTTTDDNAVIIDLSAPRIGLREVARALEESRGLMALVRSLATAGVELPSRSPG